MGYPPIAIVDENDEVIGQMPMPQAHAQEQTHRVVRIMLKNKQGKILLQKRSNKMSWPGCWDHSAAGHVDAGEDYDTAAKREMFEEIGVKTKLRPIGKYYSEDSAKGLILKRFNQVYEGLIDFTPEKLQTEEVSEVKWFTLSEVKELINQHRDQVTDGIIYVISRYY